MVKNTAGKNNEYNNESITQLKGAERVRLRPSVIFGSDDITGCQHSIFEIISNSIDEAREGYGRRIEITRHADGSITNVDYGRGIPVDYNTIEEKYNWELIFCELYAGGKYNNNDNDNYQFSLGLNGLGLCSAQYASRYMDVKIYRDGFEYSLYFERGENVGGLKKEIATNARTGTVIRWLPDDEVFKDINVPLSYFKDMLKKQAIVNDGLVFVLRDEASGEKLTYCYETGIRGYIAEIISDDAITEPVHLTHETTGRDRQDLPDYRLKFAMTFCFDNKVNLCEYYHNSSWLEYGGSPDRAVKNAFVAAIDAYIKAAGLYKKDEKKLTFTDIEDSLVLISSSFSTVTSYENQTKKAINNRFIQEAMTDYLKKQLSIYFVENKIEADKIAAQVMANKRSRETAEKTRLSIKKKLTGGMDFTNRAEKFVNCRTKDITRRELYIVEGDSAMGACKLGRDAEFQAIMPVRGKILNCLKADYNKIFANDIITDLIRVLGCGVAVASKHGRDLDSFDIDKLNWAKVIICTDADVDGFHIRTQVLTMLYRLTPELITQKKVFIAESPLYEITAGKNTHFAYTDAEKNAICAKIKGNYRIQRSKGLGENEPDMLWHTTMNPATRKLIQVMPEDVQRTQEMFEVLLGDNIKGRKEFIEEHGHRYLEMVDVV
ncbi:MAG: toprim domain-containing protein [Defluviitaleaceae bacterium]|nr:toprim domain-containing protein [Defluviitaleaceae bacterium]